MTIQTTTDKINDAVSSGSISLEDRNTISDELIALLDDARAQYDAANTEVDQLFSTLSGIQDEPPTLTGNKYLEAVDIMHSLVQDLDLNSYEGLDFWAHTQVVEPSLSHIVQAGNGIYQTTGLSTGSTLSEVLNALNSLGDDWDVINGSFINVQG